MSTEVGSGDETAADRDGPRILPVVEPDEHVAAMLATGWQHNGQPLDLPRIFANHPRLLHRFSVFAGLFLMKSSLPDRDRELLTLRSTVRAGTEYYFGHHVATAERVGIDASTRLALTDPSYRGDGTDAVLIAVADELVLDGVLTDETWRALSVVYPDPARQLEALFIPGFYRMVAGVANTIRVEREDGVPGWPTAEGS